ncbi:MAG: gluconokinase [Verrucomicrobia bacterium]|nr:gluconokinase [Verrucomicrobiota bacterium]
MGVTGCGKTTVAQLFAQKIGAVFYEGDDFHPPENIAKMRAGIPLTDADRAAWLLTLRKIISDALAKNTFIALTCSALKTKYREQLQAGDARVQFIHLTAPRAIIESRLRNRTGHFMPASLLDSQLAILEPPAGALTFDTERRPEEIVARLIQALGLAVTD